MGRETQNAATLIQQRLASLISDALELTSAVLLEQEQAIAEVRRVRRHVGDPDKSNIVVKLATQRNSLLVGLIEEVTSYVRTAEDYFAEF